MDYWLRSVSVWDNENVLTMDSDDGCQGECT